MSDYPIRLSCGHGVHNMDDAHPATIKEWIHDQSGTHRAFRHGTVCHQCLAHYRENNLLLENDEQTVDWVTEEDIVYRLQKRAQIRRQIPGRKSVQEGKPDRIVELLEKAAQNIIELRGY
jgi:hypothetical protein